MPDYKQFQQTYSNTYNQYQKKYQQILYLVFLVVGLLLLSIYRFIATSSWLYLGSSFLCLLAYLFLLKIQDRLKWKRDLAKTKIAVLENEMLFTEKQIMPFANGAEYAIPHHPYTNDLDIFGNNSLFQYLNRTATYIGSSTLANYLSTFLQPEEIIRQQEAVRELAPKTEWRQRWNAIAILIADQKKIYTDLLQWARVQQPLLPKLLILAAVIFPLIFWGCFFMLYTTGTGFWFNCTTAAFIFNNVILASQKKKILQELVPADKIDKIIRGYGLLIQEIETGSFQSEKLLQLQQQIKTDAIPANKQIQKLSRLFGNIQSIENIFGALILNGLFLSHLHMLQQLLRWKAKHRLVLEKWLSTIGEMEALNSLANFCANNPEAAFPVLNTNYTISFTGLAHPLIKKEKRIANDVSFLKQKFMLLSGSNMSGKSTFLRTLGVNMVLAGTGGPVLASSANIHLLPIYASMRLEDSLAENESYFFAEIKRLQFIKEALDKNICFVLLDEILRGTNSDDKQNGTIQVIRKMMAQNAIGVIATHDLEVCAIASDHADQLFNKCFEVTLLKDDLHFDYKLRDGICKNKSASFLMEKLGII